VIRPWSVPEHQDPLFSIWRLYQWARNVAEHPWRPFDGNIFYPAADVLLFSDAIALPALAGAPFILVGVPPLFVYNALVLAAFLTAGLGMYLWARDLSGSRSGGLIGAVVFTGAPFRVEHFYHLELLWACWIPLALWASQRVMSGQRPGVRYLSLALAAQFLSSIYYGLFLLTVLPIVVGLTWLARPVVMARSTFTRATAGVLLAAVVIGLYAAPYANARRTLKDRSAGEISSYGAELVNYAATPAGNVAWGWTSELLGAREKRLSAGVLAYALTLPALLPPVQPWAVGLLGGALVAFDASRGLDGVVYRVLHRFVTPYRGLRVPARFAMIVLAMVAGLAALGVARVEREVFNRRRWRVMTAAALAGLLAEYATSSGMRDLPSDPPEVYAWLGTQPPTVIAHFPMPSAGDLPGREADFQFFAQFHRHELVNGNSGYYPPSYITVLDRVHNFPDARSLVELRRLGVTLVIVHSEHYARQQYHRIILDLGSLPDVEWVGTHADDRGLVQVFRLRPP